MKIILTFFILLTSLNVFSQDHLNHDDLGEFCVTDILHQKKLKSDKQYALRLSSLNNMPLGVEEPSSQVYTIPVVVHIIHNNGSENISDQQVIEGIKHLNDAFRYIAPFNGAGGADIEIAFCLAKQDPSGNFTTGINRVVSPLTDLDMNYDQVLKNLIRWDTKKYLNIWLVREICSGASCGVAGYAYLAAAHGQPYDGIVNEAKWFGSSESNSKVHIHEVGHYLNLYHTFQGGCKNDNCLMDGDQVCDTPPDQSTAPVYPCNSIVNTCTTDDDDLSPNNPFRPVALGGIGDQNDMFNNYMDYGYQQCQNVFTPGQKVRMRTALLNIRSSLLNSMGCQNPCTNPVTASFTPLGGNIAAGAIVTLTNSSIGASSYQWKVNGINFSTDVQPIYNFNSSGTYNITLIAGNGQESCKDSVTQTYTVVCPVAASYTVSDNTPVVGQSISFTNTSVSAANYNWAVNGVSFSGSENTSYTFNSVGTYTIELYAQNSDGTCIDVYTQTLNVVCDVVAQFNTSSSIVPIGETISFNNTSQNANSYQWLINGVNFSTATNISYTFNSLGNNSIGLITSNGLCSDTFYSTVRVVDPCVMVNKEANVWYFGINAGIDFNSGSPVALTNGKINTREGVASISDKDGNLLFYTDGMTVWNKNHQVMNNGSNLLGHNSSTQSAVVVQNPGNPEKYYLFTADINTNGYRYSEIDMSLFSGLGGVISGSKNTLLYSTNTEKLVATRHANGKDVWLVTHQGNTSAVYRTYLITASGISAPIYKTIGSSVYHGTGDWNSSGVMKFSPDGKKLVTVFNGVLYRAELFDFNTSTGDITGPVATISPLSACYGAEFSPDGKLLYISEMARSTDTGANYTNLGGVSQYNLMAGNNMAINSSRIELVKVPVVGYGSMQLAPDGKIYISRENGFNIGVNYLAVINSPNVLGLACNYQDNGFYLGGRQTLIGLPNFISSYFSKPTFTFIHEQQCNSTQVAFTINSVDSSSTWKWIFGDPASGINDTSYYRDPIHNFSAMGSFEVRLIRRTSCGNNDTIVKTVVLQNNPVPAITLKDTISCSSQPIILDAGNPGASYNWSTGATTKSISVYTDGEYWVKVTYGACSASDTISVGFPKKSKEGNIWYFGDKAGLDFNSGVPVPLTDGVMNIYEGTASIADKDGNLLFYTDGITVYNKKHQVMANGTGLMGHFSTSQSGVIVPHPGNDSLYYIFTIDELAKPNGLRYSIVNRYLEGGLGRVVQKNTPVHTPVTEKLTATYHSNGRDVWVIAHEWNSNKFLSYLITSSGINSTPVISSIGVVHSGGSQFNYNTVGCMKVSPDGKQLALAVRDMQHELFDFDNSTGVISNYIKLPGYGVNYGLEFSPDNSKLYAIDVSARRLYQFNLLAGTPTQIAESATVVGTTTGIQLGQLQLGPDGKIYVARTISSVLGADHLGVINDPNALGIACNYVDQGLYLGGKASKSGLPNFITSTFNPSLKLSGERKVCLNDEEIYVLKNNSNFIYNWNISGHATISENNDSTVTIKFTSPGNVKIKVQGTQCMVNSKDSIEVQVVDLPSIGLKDTSLCSDDFPVELSAIPGYHSYEWSTGSTSSSISVSSGGTFSLKVKDGRCEARDTILVENRGSRAEVTINDTTICEGGIVNFNAGPGYKYLWQDGSSEPVYTAYLEGKYWVRVENACNSASDTAVVTVDELPLITFAGLDSIYCFDKDTIDLTGSPGGGVYSGSGITGNKFYSEIAGIGEHEIRYTFTNSNGCTGDNIQKVKLVELPAKTQLKDLSVCNSTFPITLYPGDYAGYEWQDGSSGPSYQANSSGEFVLTVTNEFGCSRTDTMYITVQPSFDINIKDTIICSGGTATFKIDPVFDYCIWNNELELFDFSTSIPGQYSVMLRQGCETAMDTFWVTQYSKPLLEILNLDSTYCMSDLVINLNANPSGGYFTGNNISENKFFIADAVLGDNTITYSYSDLNGCKSDTSVIVNVNESCMFIPNLITPNNDRQNDYFEVKGLSKNYTLEIYNNWNNLVFKKENYDNTFNGEGLSGGIYYFYLYNNKINNEYKGWLHILK